MKFSECNARQKKAWRNTKYAAIDYIFGLQNVCLDNAKDSEEYKSAYETLNDLELLCDIVYVETMSTVCDEGVTFFGKEAEQHMKEIRFCGKEFIMKIVTKYCKQFQTEALSQLD